MIVTQWFEPTMRPCYSGIYELQGIPYPFLWWNGAEWNYPAETPKQCADAHRIKHDSLPHSFGSGYPARCKWRGLAEPA